MTRSSGSGVPGPTAGRTAALTRRAARTRVLARLASRSAAGARDGRVESDPDACEVVVPGAGRAFGLDVGH